MDARSIEQISFIVGPAVASLVAGMIATLRPPGARLRGAILHFAGGVVFSVVAVELIPDLLREHAPVYTAVGFALGVATMLGVRALLESKEADEEEERTTDPDTASHASAGAQPPSIPMAMLVGTGVDLGVDGILLGIGFAAGVKEALLRARCSSRTSAGTLSCSFFRLAVLRSCSSSPRSYSSRPTKGKRPPG